MKQTAGRCPARGTPGHVEMLINANVAGIFPAFSAVLKKAFSEIPEALKKGMREICEAIKRTISPDL